MDAVCGVHQARAIAVHCLICHRVQINQKAELVISVELRQDISRGICLLCFPGLGLI